MGSQFWIYPTIRPISWSICVNPLYGWLAFCARYQLLGHILPILHCFPRGGHLAKFAGNGWATRDGSMLTFGSTWVNSLYEPLGSIGEVPCCSSAYRLHYTTKSRWGCWATSTGSRCTARHGLILGLKLSKWVNPLYGATGQRMVDATYLGASYLYNITLPGQNHLAKFIDIGYVLGYFQIDL